MTAGAVSAGHLRENSGQCMLPCASAGPCALPHVHYTADTKAELLQGTKCGVRVTCFSLGRQCQILTNLS